MAEASGVELVCPRCRPDHQRVLDVELTCPGCGIRHPSVSVGDGPSVAVLLDDDDAAAGLGATEQILEGLDQEHFAEALAAHPSEASSLAIFGGAHFGQWARPPLSTSSLRWITDALERVPSIPPGPALLLGAATGAEALCLPPSRDVVVLDGSIVQLAFASSLAGSDQWLPVQTTPNRWTRRRIELPEPVRARLRKLQWIAADARQPPLRPGTFAIVLALNLVDSITHPAVLLQQAQALLAPGGGLLLSSPFNWDDGVTEPSLRLDADVAPGDDHAEGVEARVQALLPRMRLCWSDRDVPWSLRIHDRLRCEFSLHAMLLQREA
ncbi:MAG: hypothetical protein AAF799_27275 [Myxococcota bacterium]